MNDVAETRKRMSPGVLAAVALVVLATAGAVVDRVAPASPRTLPSVGAVTPGGVWACPATSFGKLGGFVSLANGSLQASVVRVQFIRDGKAPQEFGLNLPPGHATSIKVPAGTTSSGAVVQWAGGDVVASRTAMVSTPQGRSAAVGAVCSRTGEPFLVAGGLRTLNADARLVLLNPSSADAVVDVSFLLDGDEQTPETLSSRVVPARGRLEVRVGDFVFDKPNVAAAVRVTTGAVVADGVLIAPQGAQIVPATAPVRDGVAAGESRWGARVDVVAVGDEPSTVVATTILPRSQQTTTGFPGALDPFGPAAVAFPERGPLGVALSGREGAPFVASLGWSVNPRGAGDTAAVPFVSPSRRWLAVTQSPSGAPPVRMMLVNPGTTPARVRARLLTASGQVASGELADITIPPGRVAAYLIGTGGAAIGVEVVAVDGAVGFSLVVAGGSGDAAILYSVAGTSSQPAPRTAVVVDPRTGVPARL